MEIKHLIGIQIKNIRKSKGMTQEEFAEKAGISSKYLSSIERAGKIPLSILYLDCLHCWI
jgi:transcriptional regulator with XRE-family HTH domain